MKAARRFSSAVMKPRLLALLLGALLPAAGWSYPVSEGRRTVALADGTKVNLVLDSGDVKGASVTRLVAGGGGRRYYYLPTNLRLSQRADGVPEFLFLKFTSEARETAGGVNGALLHFLMEYGLTAAQEEELRGKLKQTGDDLIGGMPMKPDGDTSTFLITSATLKDEGMTKSLVTSGKAPLLPGQKVAAAARLTGNGAQLLAATFEKARSITDVSVSLNVAYTVVTPAVQGSAVFHASRLETERERLKKAWEHSHVTTGTFLGLWETSGEDTYSYTEMRDQWKFLQDQKIVEVKFVELVNDERANKIRDAVFQNFLESFFRADKPNPQDMMRDESAPATKPADDAPGVQGDHFRSSIYRRKQTVSKEDKQWNFSYSLPVTETMQVTGNLGAWYDGVRYNAACVAAVNLNDPFFTHRDINFILDLEAKDMFEKSVNYVTINVRKNRSTGRPYEDHCTIDASHLGKSGLLCTKTYARADDTNPETYQYQAQWSLKGGNVFPTAPPWVTGTWEGVTLAPPVRPLSVELEGDLDALKAKDITRVTAEVRLFQLSVVGGQAVVTSSLFRDRDAPKYAYRLVYNHKTAGKLVGPWVKEQSDGYVYAAIPEDLLVAQEFKDRARSLAAGATEKVLDRVAGPGGGF